MLLISARVVPAIAFAKRLPERAPTLTDSPSIATSTSLFTSSARLPFGPFTVSARPFNSTVTPLLRGTGRFATLDIACHSLSLAVVAVPLRALRNDAQHFAAVPFGARLAVAHDAARRGDDRNAQPALHDRQLVGRFVNAQARP